MNKIIVVYLLTVLALILSACGSSEGTSTQAAAQSDPAAAELPTETKLLLGTFNLEGTHLAVTAEQAAELLPLWQVYNGLLTSDTAAQEEVDALAEQIQETMTAAQLQAIEDMDLTGQDMFARMQEQGVNLGAGPSASSGSDSSAASSGMPAGGDPGAGGVPPDMGGDPAMGGQAASSDASSDAQPSSQVTGGEMGIPTGLIEALIELLQSKIAS